jgi:hypothetical protein
MRVGVLLMSTPNPPAITGPRNAMPRPMMPVVFDQWFKLQDDGASMVEVFHSWRICVVYVIDGWSVGGSVRPASEVRDYWTKSTKNTTLSPYNLPVQNTCR